MRLIILYKGLEKVNLKIYSHINKKLEDPMFINLFNFFFFQCF